MANALRDILGFAGGAADAVLLGGAVGKSRRRNQFSDLLGQGQYDQAEQLALRNGEGAYAQLAQQRGQQKTLDERTFTRGALTQIRALPVEARPIAFQALTPFAREFGFDDQDLQEVAGILGDDNALDALLGGLGGGAADQETFGVAPQFIRQPDGSVRAVQFGNRGTIRAQDAGGVPLPIEQRFIGLDQGQQRINQAYELASPELKGAQSYNSGYGRELGKEAAGAQFNLPKTEQNASQTLALIDKATAHPGFKSRYGFQGAYTPAIAGTPGADFEAIRDQLNGKAFLQAFESLKGGGQITEVEGKKATDAISRIFDPKQSPQAAREAFAELRQIIELGTYRAQQQAATQNPYGGGRPVQQQSGPQPGTIEEGYRFLGGDPADPNNWEPAQ